MSVLDKLKNSLYAALSRKDIQQARDISTEILRLDTSFHFANFILAMEHFRKKSFVEAEIYFEKAIEYSPNNAEYQIFYVKCLIRLKKSTKAIKMINNINWTDVSNVGVLCSIGQVFSTLDRHQKALLAFEKALDLEPNSVVIMFNFATTLKYLGDFEQARKYFEKIITIAPEFCSAHYSLSSMVAASKENNNIKRLLSIGRRVQYRGFDEIQILHALYLEYEAIGEYTNAISCLEKANQIYCDSLKQKYQERGTFTKQLNQYFEKNTSEPTGKEQKFIFVLGMPRTGTTLMDQIISSHSKVLSVGETNYFQDFIERKLDLAGSDCSHDLKTEDNQVLVDGFLSICSSEREDVIFLDKSPLNYKYIGHIINALPNSRIVCMRRNPMDTCFSNFRQLFAQGISKYDYSYDLNETVEAFYEFEGVMSFWKKNYPDNILDVQYENLVLDFDLEIKHILNHCGLNFEPSCSKFYENTKSVSTASFSQVRKPLTKKYFERWKLYRTALLKYDKFHKLVEREEALK